MKNTVTHGRGDSAARIAYVLTVIGEVLTVAGIFIGGALALAL
jgi:hypothetical protein